MTDDAALPPGRRVDWIELFFDLAMVAFITELAAVLHGAPGPAQYLTFVAWSVPAWWAWINVTACVNELPPLPRRLTGVALLLATATIAVMAASVTETTDRVWAFALANGMLRLVLLVLWSYRARFSGVPLWRPAVYNGVTALLWIGSALVPIPWDFAVWAAAILLEVILLRAGARSLSRFARLDVAHASERLGLFLIILMGESVVSVIVSLSAHWGAAAGLAALLGFATIALIAWGLFVSGSSIIEEGVAAVVARRDVGALLDTVMIIPYLIVASITMFAAGLATAIAHPHSAPATGSTIALGGGLALFYLTNAIVIRRYGTPLTFVLPWAAPGVILPLALVAIASVSGMTATPLLAGGLGVVVLVTVVSVLNRRRPGAVVGR